MVASAHATATGLIEVLVYVDDDDPTVYQPDGYRIVTGPRITLSDCWNKLAGEAQGDILQMAADDIRYRTGGWDTQVAQVFDQWDDRILFVYTRDGIHDARLGTHGFVSKEWVETVGYFTPDMFPADYADTWLNELAARIDRRVYLPSVLVEHLHPIAGKAPWDQTHKERLARRGGVEQMWLDTQPLRDADTQKLAAAL